MELLFSGFALWVQGVERSDTAGEFLQERGLTEKPSLADFCSRLGRRRRGPQAIPAL